MDAKNSLEQLKEGNARYVSGDRKQFDLAKRREELLAGQHPYVTIISCSDSRVVPEYIFDAQMGELFIVRTAGNIVDGISLGSLEYGCEHLHTPLLVVLGHSDCGAVKATCGCKGKCDEGHIKDIVKVVDEVAKKEDYDINKTIRGNISCCIEAIRKESKIISHLEKEGKLRILGAMYSLESGKVEFY